MSTPKQPWSFNDELVEESCYVLMIKEKKKKRTIERVPCMLLLTQNSVGCVDSTNNEIIKKQFPKSCLREVVVNEDSTLCTLEIKVDIDGSGKLRSVKLEFTSENAIEERNNIVAIFNECIAANLQQLNQLKQKQEQNLLQPDASAGGAGAGAAASAPGATGSAAGAAPTKKALERDALSRIDQKTIERRCWLLATSPKIQRLYANLVETGILSPNEFFAKYDPQSRKLTESRRLGSKNDVMSNTMEKHQTWSLMGLMHRKGISFDKDKNDSPDANEADSNGNNSNSRQREGSNKPMERGKIKLKREDIMEIFIHLPYVEITFDRMVRGPQGKWNAQEFWSRFVKTSFFKKETSASITSHSDRKTELDRELEQSKHQLENSLHYSGPSAWGGNGPNGGGNASYAAQMESNNNKNNKKNKQKNGEDIEMKDANNGMTGANGVMSDLAAGNQARRVRFDPAIDLPSTIDSFTEVIEDPSNDTNGTHAGAGSAGAGRNGAGGRRGKSDVQAWFGNINKHGMLLLEQSLGSKKNDEKDEKKKQKNKSGKNAMEVDGDDGDDMGMGMESYHARVERETNLMHLMQEKSPEFIELRIKDQSVYWGTNQLLQDSEKLEYLQSVGDVLSSYKSVGTKGLNAMAGIVEIADPEQSGMLMMQATKGNHNQAQKRKFAERNEMESKKQARLACKNRNYEEKSGIDKKYENKIKKRDLKIFADKGEEIVKFNTLQTIEKFAKPMMLLITHYWACFPINSKLQWDKAELIIEQLKRYQASLKTFENGLRMSRNARYTASMTNNLNQMLNKVFDHFERNRQDIASKRQRLRNMTASVKG